MRSSLWAPSARKRFWFPKLDREEGRISLLMLGLGLIVFMVIAVGANVTVLHLEYGQLQFEADNLATMIAAEESDPSYYSQTPGTEIGDVSLKDAQLKLDALIPASEQRIMGRRVISVETEGGVGADRGDS